MNWAKQGAKGIVKSALGITEGEHRMSEIQAAMIEIGRVPPLLDGSVVWFAANGHFSKPGLYIWDGSKHHQIVKWADLSIAMSEPDTSDETPTLDIADDRE